MEEQNIPKGTFKTEDYRFQVGVFIQIIIFLLGYVASNPLSEKFGIDSAIIVIIIGLISFTIYLIPGISAHNGEKTIPNYWNNRIIATQKIRMMAEKEGFEFMWKYYLMSLEIQYQTALLEGRIELANRFKELITKYEDKIK
jgi:hypothetical protein